MASAFALKKASQAWCKPTTAAKVMDPELCEAFAEIIDEIASQAWLDNATNIELITELKVRLEISGLLEYRTVDNVKNVSKYRKKPVIVDAIKFDGDCKEIFEWARQWHDEMNGPGMREINNGKDLMINTLEGEHRASKGDYIIRGIKGELYLCKPDIFEATYEIAIED